MRIFCEKKVCEIFFVYSNVFDVWPGGGSKHHFWQLCRQYSHIVFQPTMKDATDPLPNSLSHYLQEKATRSLELILPTTWQPSEGFKLDQRSKIRCQHRHRRTWIRRHRCNNRGTELQQTRVGIANGTYAGGTILPFSFGKTDIRSLPAAINCQIMHLTCQLLSFIAIKSSFPKPGVNRTNPMNTLDVNGKLRVGDDSSLLRLVASGGMQLAMILKVIMALNGCRLPNPMAVKAWDDIEWAW